jgi:hypothetical protein
MPAGVVTISATNTLNGIELKGFRSSSALDTRRSRTYLLRTGTNDEL